jgi:copper chaperone CopZ
MIAEYTVSGMSCDHCIHSVTTELMTLTGVCGVQIDLATGRVQVSSTEPISGEEISAAIDEAGYELVGVPANS